MAVRGLLTLAVILPLVKTARGDAGAISTSVAPSATVAVSSNGLSVSSLDLTSMASVAAMASATAAALANRPVVLLPNDTNLTDALTLSNLLAEVPPPEPQVSQADIQRMLTSLMYPVWSDNTTEASALATRAGSQRVMIVGDSMTQGADGDWTWRYRMWQWARSQGLNWNFVGPYTGTIPADVDQGPPQPPPLQAAPPSDKWAPVVNSGGYSKDCDPAFTQAGGWNHFSVWGRAVAFDISNPPNSNTPLLQGMVQQYQPDILLVHLGFNDLGWFYSDASGLLQNMGTLVQQARNAQPNIKIVIANVVQRSWISRQDLVDNTNYYNAHIGALIDQWNTAQSPIRLAHLSEIYGCGPNDCPAGYDGLHPDALGDFQVARAFSLTLADNTAAFQLPGGISALQIPNPVPLRPVPVPSNLKVVTSPQGVTATWDPVFGAYSYNIQTSLDGNTWTTASTRGPRWDTHWPGDGLTYYFRVSTSCGNHDYLNSAYTGTQSAVSRSQLASGPLNIMTSPLGADGLQVQWSAPTTNANNIVEYTITIWDLDTRCAFWNGVSWASSPATFTGLNQKHRYMVFGTAWNQYGEGFPNIAKTIVVGGSTPATPSVPTLQEINPAALHITWNGDIAYAGGYTFWVRNINNASDYSKPTGGSGGTCGDVYYLFPGYWNYEWCVQAFNGDKLQSNVGPCTVLPSPTASQTSTPTCPPPAPWCS